MERAGLTPRVAPDTSDLAGLGDAAGPFLTVQLTTEADVDNAAQRSEQRWRPIRDVLGPLLVQVGVGHERVDRGRNAADAADQVVRLARRVDARLVVAAGDERAVALLREALPEEWAARFQVVSAGRSRDGSEQSFDEQARISVELAVNADTDALMEKFREERGQDDRAADGPAATPSALSMAAADVLLLTPDNTDDPRTAWFGPDPTQVARTAADLRGLGVEQPVEGRLVDVAVRTALGTGASIHVVEAGAGLGGGIGAILRWST